MSGRVRQDTISSQEITRASLSRRSPCAFKSVRYGSIFNCRHRVVVRITSNVNAGILLSIVIYDRQEYHWNSNENSDPRFSFENSTGRKNSVKEFPKAQTSSGMRTRYQLFISSARPIKLKDAMRAICSSRILQLISSL